MTKRVLVVDDDMDICHNLKDILDELGYLTDIAGDGFAALDLIASHSYDIALLDYQMPGMDGAALHEEIVQQAPETAAVMITAYAAGDGAQRAQDSGVQQILSKPVDLSELLPLIERLTSSPIVLVVDDDSDFCRNLWHVLRDKSYRVAIANSEQQALEKLENSDFQIALVDLSLDRGVEGGFEVLQNLTGPGKQVKVILMTGHRAEASRAISEFEKKNLVGVCYKPLEISNLLDLLSTCGK